MWQSDDRSELIRAVKERGEAVPRVAARLGVPRSTAYGWLRGATAATDALARPAPTFVEVVAEREMRSTILVRVGAAEIEVRAGFDARLLREVVDVLGSES